MAKNVGGGRKGSVTGRHQELDGRTGEWKKYDTEGNVMGRKKDTPWKGVRKK